MQHPPQFRRAFTLVELMVVIAIITVMAGLALPAVNSLTRGNELSSASRMTSEMLAVARTEAITKNVVTRFAISTRWGDQPDSNDNDSNYRKISVWKQNDAGIWEQIGKWETIPQGVVFEPQYSSTHDLGTSGSNTYLISSSGTFSTTVGGKAVDMKYAEFTPAGAARTADPTIVGGDLWVALVPGYITSGSLVNKSSVAGNYAKVSANVLTGRIKISRP